MTAEELLSFDGYGGATPRPEDFEEFWETRVREADRAALRYTISQAKEVPSFEGCDMLDLWFEGMKGGRLYAKYLRPRSRKPVPLVLHKEQTSAPEGCLEGWRRALAEMKLEVSMSPVDLGNPMGVYEMLRVSAGGKTLTARCIRPAAGEEKCPVILMYHDLNRGVRGWHHMTRFLAFGYGVVALEAEPVPGNWTPEMLRQRYLDALAVGKAALALPWVEGAVSFGEGFGGGLALLAAALLPGEIRCAALNHFPADLPEAPDLDLANAAPLCRGDTLMGTCLMDTYASPKGQAAIYNRLKCKKKWKIYPKYGHERVNFFENELVSFLKNGIAE